ncbi:MAG: hypothetical protein CVV64_18510 [Candidatus Wallbacteria bacterium HGW-Wallbacteria-1]|jgi:ABC-2 type transport system ATP-binding protein|uniref:ABC transporter domain-containing protein n=1 Tax=Candidatus Wallbacteria bacterium HGW-Wallbacteria-1 TaxID=2013854 RepID=A0A2N1PJH7_9BACT|nr:MAG: hypothetical protein CVV64_18510 [Candidatus Wallbacteria bacterium HGW-Wallbacteria-1]
MGEHAIHIQGVSKSFGRRKILDDITIQVKPGECYALMGRNGAGKSTLVNMLKGMLTPDKGKIDIFGINPITCSSGFIPRISFVSERRGIFPDITVGRTLELARDINPLWDMEEQDRLLKHLKMNLSSKTNHLSKGEQGKLILLIALAVKPDLMIMDEPTSGLDPYVRRLLFEGIISLMLDAGKTVFYVTHELHEAQRIAKQIAFIREGRICLEGCQDTLRASHRRIEARFDNETPLPALNGVLNMRRYSDRVFMDIPNFTDDILFPLREAGFDRIEVLPASLEDIFCMHLGDEEVC